MKHLVNYCKKLFVDEYDNMLKSIHGISEIENKDIETNFISVYNQKVSLNMNLEKSEKISVKIYNIFGVLEYESVYNASKEEKTTVIDVSSFNKGIYIIQVIIGDKTISQKISI